jgi:integrase
MLSNILPCNFAIKLTSAISETIHLQPEIIDVKKLLLEGRYEELATIPISVDRYGKVISCFGEMTWYLWPYFESMGRDNKSTLNFTFLEDSPQILLEIKVILYTWLRIRSNRNTNKRIKVETLVSRYENLRQVHIFLMKKKFSSLALLCAPDTWADFESFLAQRCLSFGRVIHILCTINVISWIREYLPFSFQLPIFNIDKLAKRLAAEDRDEVIQTYAIPQRLTDLLYGESLSRVEFAWPNRGRIAELVQQQYDLYYEVKNKVDMLIDSDDPAIHGNTRKLSKIDRNTYSRPYRDAIDYRLGPLLKASTDELLSLAGHHLQKKNIIWPEYVLNNLLTACYICTHAFTGMRPSEVYQLQPGCYATRIVNGQTFHVLQGATHKLPNGIKHDEWLCSPGTGKAVELAEALTLTNRKHLQSVAETYIQAGNKGEATRFSRLSNCLWLRRLNYFKIPKASAGAMRASTKLFASNIGAIVTEDDLIDFKLLNRNSTLSFIPPVGHVWPFHPRQMRRTFAVFGSRNNLTGIAATKQQFKHIRIRMTEYYCSGASEARSVDVRLDTELMEMIFEARIDDEATELHQLYNSDEKLAGGRGKVIMEERWNDPHKYSSFDTVKQLVKQGKLTYHSTGVAGCANGYNCEMDGVVNPAFCVECDGAIITVKHAQNWKQKHDALILHLEENPTISPNEFSHFITQIRAAELAMTDHNIPFIHFDNEKVLTNI